MHLLVRKIIVTIWYMALGACFFVNFVEDGIWGMAATVAGIWATWKEFISWADMWS